MFKLYAMRHAKSSWDFPDLLDFERPLNKRGIESSKKICERFVKNKIFFDLILTSSSKRTLETLSYLNGPAEKAKILKLKELYNTSEIEILKIIKKVDDKYKSLLLINHMPSIKDFCSKICLNQNSNFYKDMCHKFSTAAVAEFEFKFKSWKDLDLGGKITNFIRPKDI